LTPVAALKPVPIGGTTVSRATLHNMDEIERLGVMIGDWVEVERGGDVIPKVNRVVEDKDHPRGHKSFQMPEKCPVCGGHVVRTEGEADHRCVNTNRSEEHTSELQSPYDLVCRLLLEKKNIK